MLDQIGFLEKFEKVQKMTVGVTRQISAKIKPGQPEKEIVDMYYQALANEGLGNHWYTALVYVGESTSLPISRCYHLPSEEVVVKENDIVMLDCTPQDGTVWGNWAETFVVGRDVFLKSLLVTRDRSLIKHIHTLQERQKRFRIFMPLQ